MFPYVPRRIADLLDYPVSIRISCGCTRVVVARPGWFLAKLGEEATIEDGERRLICRTCKQRPVLVAEGDWAVTGGRDRRQNPEPMPRWVKT